uniref:FCP1 homology domain-containing protein n=1 Tax=Chromulina nebulosa TaxID=96789 RepID=A0A7S0SZ94_9STRA|mmetsp:Transcript_584/g.507  ORF Transcript_584/g.507 Transcript_584/m.507 type:complete len:384 (+) Transcript_584:28-1179(+)
MNNNNSWRGKLSVTWRDNTYLIDYDTNTTYYELTLHLHRLTQVSIDRLRLIGLAYNGKSSIPNNQPLKQLTMKYKDNVAQLKMLGTPENEINSFIISVSNSSPSNKILNLNDFLFPFPSNTREYRKLNEFTNNTQIKFISLPRENKKLLILDLDHTLVDFTSMDITVSVDEMKRPFMDYFLAQAYQYYDLAIWSQTNWAWVEVKITELGLLNNKDYKICFVLDKTSMFSIRGSRCNIDTSNYCPNDSLKEKKLKVKPLHIIWGQHPEIWSEKNTIHVDDLSRNFLLNPKSGIAIKPFYRDPLELAQAKLEEGNMLVYEPGDELIKPTDDTELLLLLKYLLHIAKAPNVTVYDHSIWRETVRSSISIEELTKSTNEHLSISSER